MKRMLKASGRLAVALGLAVLSLAAAAEARQSRDSRVISAKAGGVNLVAGGAEFRRAGEKVWMSLSTKDDLVEGDAVRTAGGGRVELLLNPGTYWRADGSTEFALTSTALDDLNLRLDRGSAVVEATGFGDYDVALVVNTPQGRVRLARAGVYRFNVLPTGETLLVVEKGRAYVGAGDGLKVKGGKVVRLGGSAAAPELTKFDKKTRDAFDLWSRERGRELAKANEKLSARQTNAMLARLDFDHYFSASNPGSGFWFWNSAANCYTFLSFYPGWRSPYGYDYRSWFLSPYSYRCPSCQMGGDYRGGGVYMPVPNNGGNQTGGNGGLNNGNGGGSNPGGGAIPSGPPVSMPPARIPEAARPFPGPRERMVDPNRGQM